MEWENKTLNNDTKQDIKQNNQFKPIENTKQHYECFLKQAKCQIWSLFDENLVIIFTVLYYSNWTLIRASTKTV